MGGLLPPFHIVSYHSPKPLAMTCFSRPSLASNLFLSSYRLLNAKMEDHCKPWVSMTLRALRQLAIALCIALVTVVTAIATDSPNIVVFLVDDMGVMDSSVPFLTDDSGAPVRYPLNDFYRTPNMEQLAKNGIRFSTFNAMSVCSPSRIAIMTGQNPARHKTTNWIDPDNNNAGPNGPPKWNWQGLGSTDVTLPKLLQSNGYRTIHVGKGHFGPRDSVGSNPLNLGFDVNVAGSSIGMPTTYYGQRNYGNAGNGVAKAGTHAVPGLEKYHGSETFLTEALTRESISEITSAVQAGKPFFLNLAHYAVHGPFDSDPRFASEYVDARAPPLAKAFATLVAGMDKSLGDIISHLESLGVAENTLILFLGDNGTDAPLGPPHTVACAAPLRGKKGSHYEGGTRAPFIAAWAKPNSDNAIQKRIPISQGAIQSQMAAIYDLFPTILEVANVTSPQEHTLDGKSLLPLLTGVRDSSRADRFLMHYPHAPHRTDYFTTLRIGDWKVIYHYFPSEVSGGSHYQLFHLAVDPFEQKDLSLQEPEELKRMMRAMSDELVGHGALYPVDPKSKREMTLRLPE